MVQATTLQPGHTRHLLRLTSATSRRPGRDSLGLPLRLTAGILVTEVAQLALQDVLVPSGALCAEISLRAQITKGCRQRYIYLSHIKAVEAFDRYLDYRIVRCYARLAIPAGVEEWNRQAADLDAQGLHVLPEYKAACELGGAGQAGYLACNSLQSESPRLS